MRLFRPINPTRLLLIGALAHGPRRLRLSLVGERRLGEERVPADVVVDAESSSTGRTLSGVLSFEDRGYAIRGRLWVSRVSAELLLDVDGLGSCHLAETQLPRARLQTGLSLTGCFERAANCQLELRLDFKQVWRDLY